MAYRSLLVWYLPKTLVRQRATANYSDFAFDEVSCQIRPFELLRGRIERVPMQLARGFGLLAAMSCVLIGGLVGRQKGCSRGDRPQLPHDGAELATRSYWVHRVSGASMPPSSSQCERHA